MALQYVTTGDIITSEPGFLRGHGTLATDDNVLVATVTGFVERVNKLISVRPLLSRYQGEVGDVVVGRIFEVADKCWRVDLNARQAAMLNLSSVNLPGGVQRRRTEEDQLQMRAFFAENELISAEVQKCKADGTVSLHTRNLKYGKLTQGQFISVPSALIKRSKQHFHSLPNGVDVILGNNGYVWLQATAKVGSETDTEAVPVPVPAEVRQQICRVRNAVLALAAMHISIYRDTVMDVCRRSEALGLPAKAILDPSLLQTLTEPALARAGMSRPT